jgi:pilus assembly protein CpaB
VVTQLRSPALGKFPIGVGIIMNQRLLGILLTAFVIASLAAYAVYRYAGAQLGARFQGQATPILVAVHDLQLGAVIHAGDVKLGQWIGPLPKNALTAVEPVIGRGVITALYQGEPVIESRLAPLGSGGGLAATIRQGMRACAVKVNDVVGVAGFALPGMRVDVLIAGTAPGSPGQGPRVKTLLQNIEVLSAGANYQKDEEGKPVQVQVVNLLVTPEQAEVLSLASNETRIQLVLRNPMDTEVSKAPGAAIGNLFGDITPPAPPVLVRAATTPRPRPALVAAAANPVIDKPTAPQFLLVDVLNGSKRTQEKFEQSEEKP